MISRRWETSMPFPRPGSRVQRRAVRTKAAIKAAFVQLVFEQGYERVAVEDISDRADPGPGHLLRALSQQGGRAVLGL
jgi:hypothetical protein